MPFQPKNKTIITLIFLPLIRVFFLVEETLSTSTAKIASWFQHHTHKLRLDSYYDVLKEILITIWIGKQFLTDFNTPLFLMDSQQGRHGIPTDATHVKVFIKNLLALSFVVPKV